MSLSWPGSTARVFRSEVAELGFGQERALYLHKTVTGKH